MVNNALSPHGGLLVEQVLEPAAAWQQIKGCQPIAVSDQVAHECINIAYGFFSPLRGFMTRADVDAVVHHMRLENGYVWSIPIVFDRSEAEIRELGIRPGDTLLLTYQNQPLATLAVEEIFAYDKEEMARHVYGTAEEKHPGVRRTFGYKDRFIGGKVTLVNPPVVNPPFDRFWLTPRQMRDRFASQGWRRVVAHQTRNVPHSGHEWLMKSAWFSAGADAVLVSAVVGEKRAGDYIDEAIVLGHDMLRTAGYFQPEVHMTSILLWDMRYAGPREAVFHAIVRKNLGCTDHMFGRDHAGVGTYYGTFAAHQVFREIPDLGIAPVLTLEWSYCPECAGIAYEGLCGHKDQRQGFSGSLIRSILVDGVKPPRIIMRPEVFDVVQACAQEYGFEDPFVTEHYLQHRRPVLSMKPLAPAGKE